MKINIYGGGLSGLTLAFELSKYNYDITIYEKSLEAGGMSKSKYSNNIPTEHSWRGYGPFYYNTFDILKQIPVDNTKCKKNIKEHFNQYTVKQIEKHNTKNDFWCYYKNNVYDLTNFVKDHPGGDIILNTAGKNMETVWDDYGMSWHKKNTSVMNILNKYKIGTLKVQENFKQQKYAIDNLKPLDFTLLFNKNKNNKNNKNKNDKKFGTYMNISDYLIIGYLFSKVFVSNNRNKVYFKTKLDGYLKKYISKSGYHYLADYIAGPGFGFDKNTMSLAHYAKFVKFNLHNNKYKKWMVMNQPTNEAWINDFVKIIKQQNVNFKFNHTLEKININNKKIINCIVNNETVNADIHVFCLNPFNFSDILKKSKLSNKRYLKLNQINNQISFRIGFSKKIKLSKNNNTSMGFVLIDSPYNITFYSQTDSWCKDYKLETHPKKIKTLLSGTIIQPYNNGLLLKKSALSLTIDQLKEEIIEQFMRSNEFLSLVTKENGITLTKKDYVYIEIYDDWYYDKKAELLKTKNKKWVNNFLNEEFRPTQQTNIENMYVGGSHTKTSINIWSMEGSIESGKIIANLILKKDKKPPVYLYNHDEKNIFINILKYIDDILYKLKLPNLIDILLIIIIIIILIKLKNILYQ